ncbi:MAG: sulfotransferase [Bacteroidota bacterium]
MRLKIIGAGVGRTGTLSTKANLEILSFEKTFHMLELFANPELVHYVDELHETGSTDYEKLFDGYAATVDYPLCLYYKALFEAHPDAKVILNVRAG